MGQGDVRNGGVGGPISRGRDLPGRDARELAEGPRGADVARNYAQLRELLRQNPELAREFGDLFRELQKLDLSGLVSANELDERLSRQAIPTIEQLELALRRKVEEQKSGQVRNAGAEPAPPGYADKVAEYFRRLSRGK